jgi:hypothetical protein
MNKLSTHLLTQSMGIQKGNVKSAHLEIIQNSTKRNLVLTYGRVAVEGLRLKEKDSCKMAWK